MGIQVVAIFELLLTSVLVRNKVLIVYQVVLGFLYSASKISHCLTHHHFLCEGASLKQLFNVFLFTTVFVQALVVLDI